MKKYFSLLLLSLVMVMCFSVSVFAEVTETDVSANQDGSVMAIFDSETGVMTISGNGPMIDYASEEDNPIAWNKVTKLVIEEGVTHIGDYAFYRYYSYSSYKSTHQLTSLTEEIVIPSTVESIGKYAFINATAPKITIGSGVTEIGQGAFKGTTMTSVEFAENSSLQTIGSGAFTSSKITSINIPEGCTTIESSAFSSCTSLETVVLPTSITTVESGIFSGCTGINDFTWLTVNADLGSDFFGTNFGTNATNKTAKVHANHIYLKDSLEAWGFTVETEGEKTDSAWDTYPDSYSYEVGAENSTDVMIYYNPYSDLMTVRGSGAMADYGAYKTGNGVYVPYYEYLPYVRKLVIEEGVTHIGSYAFHTVTYTKSYSMGALEETFAFPSTLESIGTSAFSGTNYPGALVIPVTLKTIESLPTTGITSVYFEEGVEDVSSCPSCNTITSIYIPSTATSIPSISSTSLSELIIMTDVIGSYEGNPISTSLGSNATNKTATVREGQYYLIECLEYLGFTVNTIAGEEYEPWETYPTGSIGYTPYVREVGVDGNNVLSCWNPVTSTLTFWGEGAIKDYGSGDYDALYISIYDDIRKIVFNEGITEIGDKLFGCTWNTTSVDARYITSISLPSTLTRIGNNAFYKLAASEIVIPENVETIEAGAFNSATPTAIYNLSEENQTIEDSAFYNVSSTPTVYQYRANTAMETAVADVASEIIYFDDDSVVLSGTLDNGVTWEYDPTTKTLTFGGSGEIPSYEDGSQPWYSAASTYGGVGNYVFGSGITGFGSGVIGSYGSSYGSDGSGSLFYYPSGSDGLLGSLNSYGSGGTYGGVAPSGGAGGSTDEGSDSGNTGGSTDTGDDSDSSGDSGSTGTGSDTSSDDTTMIIVDAEPTNFLVTVPIRIDVEMDADGNVTTGDGYYVENECAMGPILITDIKVVPATNWSLVDWNSDFYNMKASSKVIGLTINGVEVGSDGSVVMNDSLSSVIRNKESKELFFDAKLSAQKSTLQANAAAVVFTVDFDKV